VEFKMTRIVGLLVLAIAAGVLPAAAQDLQYRMRMDAQSPEMKTSPMPMPVTTTYVKGKKIRMDHDMMGMQTSMIVDGATGQGYVVMHQSRTYMESPKNPLAKLNADTAMLNDLGVGIPMKTGQRQMISGYDTEQLLTVMRMPKGLPGTDTTMVVVLETWAVRDPRLAAAYKPYAEAMMKFAGAGAGPSAQMLRAQLEVFPIRMTSIMISSNDTTIANAEAVLKNANDPRIRMRMLMEVSDVKLTTLPDSLFEIPKGYTLQKPN
jgi:hypothetical protein